MTNFETPVLFIIFNRIETAQQVFDAIKKRQPKYLYIAADGPRSNKEGEAEKCQKVRDLVKQIDWDCELKTLFQNQNLGCAKGVSTAITWFFDNVEQGIILEDDCLPHPDFFPYCEELLNKYKDNEEIMLISGDNFQDGIKRGEASYYFSGYINIWGWASWRRAWQGYDLYLKNYVLSDFKYDIQPYLSSWKERQVWIDKFLMMKKQGNNTWDYQLGFHMWKNKGLCIIPNVNLISNIGVYGGTHYYAKNNTTNLALETNSILPLIHTSSIYQNKEADAYLYKNMYHKTIFQLFWRFMKRKHKIISKF